MKRMILRLAYFSLLVSFVSSCGNNLKPIFERKSGLPKHPRALYVKSKTQWVIAGHNGVFEYHLGDQVILDSIAGMEDIRDAEILEDNSVVFMNSGELGRIWRYFPAGNLLCSGQKCWLYHVTHQHCAHRLNSLSNRA